MDHFIEFDLNSEMFHDQLGFWQKNDETFPFLAHSARKYFSDPCSYASVERQLSAARQIRTRRRSTLDPIMVNDILFFRSNQSDRKRKWIEHLNVVTSVMFFLNT
jgi:hAT family C-terminal dimerisation region